jgi:hypothetical protein
MSAPTPMKAGLSLPPVMPPRFLLPLMPFTGREAWERFWFVGVLVFAGFLYFWTAHREDRPWNFGAEQSDYYNLLIDGFLSGQLHMKAEVSPELLRVENPYDPRNRPPGSSLHDASFYNGKYYLYFGVPPVVTLMLPFRVLSGVDLPLPVAVAVFTYGGFLLSALVFLSLRRRYFLESGVLFPALCLIALATATLALVLPRRGNIWELPLASGYFFAMAALLAIERSVHCTRRRRVWFALAGLSLGLAVASRLSYLYATCILIAPLYMWWMQRRSLEQAGGPGWIRLGIAAAIPLLTVGVALAAYNHARFGDPLEFGVAYQLSGVIEAETRHFRFSYFPLNVWLYFWRPAEWGRYFPFVHQGELPPLPAGFVGVENLYGVLTNVPLVWLACLAPLAAWRRTRRERAALLAWTGAAGLLAVATSLTLCFFYAAMARYCADFVPALMLLACVGVLALRRCAGSQPALVRVCASLGAAVLLLFSIFFGLVLGFELYGNFQRHNPKAYARVATWFNRPAHLWETMLGTPHGPREFDVRLGDAAAGTREPLLSTGRPGRTDQVYVQYDQAGTVRIGFAHDGGPSAFSRPLSLERGAWHRVRVELGSLYPPEEHPFFAEWERPAVVRLKRWLRVEVDGEIVLDGYQRFHPATPGTVFVGGSPGSGAPRILPDAIRSAARAYSRHDLAALAAERVDGYLLRLRFPVAVPGTNQPLLAVAAKDGGSFWYCRVEGPGVRFGFVDGRGRVRESDVVMADVTQPHLLELYRLRLRGSEAADRVVVKLDGVPVWSPDVQPDVGFASAVVGRAESERRDLAPVFQGEIFWSERLAAGSGPQEPYAALRLRVKLPREEHLPPEPLVVTGRTGAADLLYIEYFEGGTIRFGLNHWGRPSFLSPILRLEREAAHVLEIAFSSFPGASPAGSTNHGFSLSVNGLQKWQQPLRMYTVEPEDVFIGYNPVGGSVCGEFFTGAILAVERVGAASRAAVSAEWK